MSIWMFKMQLQANMFKYEILIPSSYLDRKQTYNQEKNRNNNIISSKSSSLKLGTTPLWDKLRFEALT